MHLFHSWCAQWGWVNLTLNLAGRADLVHMLLCTVSWYGLVFALSTVRVYISMCMCTYLLYNMHTFQHEIAQYHMNR